MDNYNLLESSKLLEKTKKYLPGGVTYNFYKQEHNKIIYYKKGKNSRLWDIDGNEYLDLYGKSGTMFLGHNNENFQKDITKQLKTLLSVNDSNLLFKACEKINSIFPSCEMFRFGLSGTEVIQNAFRLCRAYTGKEKILRFYGHFHGNADNVLGDEYDFNTYKHIDTYTTHLSTKGRNLSSLNDSYILPWNNINIFKEFVEKNHKELCAVIMEPIMINNGGFCPDKQFLLTVRQVCSEYNIVLIFDEIISGCRVALGGAQSLYEIYPDLTILGKAISNGIPISVLGGKKEIMSFYNTKEVVHIGTYNGYPLGLAAIISTITILQKDITAYDRMIKYSNRIKEILEYNAKKNNIDFIVRGHPLCMCFSSSLNQKEYKPSRRDSINKAVIRNSLLSVGIIITPPSRIYLNTSINDEDIDFFEKRSKIAFENVNKIYNGN